MRDKPFGVILGAVWLLLTFEVGAVFGDGGALCISEQRNDRLISVFTAPTPLRVGTVDVSVLVQNTDSAQALTEIPMTVRACSIAHPEDTISAPASTAAATNKLLQAAPLMISEPGQWHIEVFETDSNATPPIIFEVEVAEPLPNWLDLGPWILWPLLPIGLFVVHELLVDRRRTTSSRRQRIAAPRYR